MKDLILNEKEYILLEDYKEGFDKEETEKKLTDYFDEYDYIIGDWAYNKLRLKGFCKKGNPLITEINNYELKDNYIRNNCAYDCKYFILEKIKK